MEFMGWKRSDGRVGVRNHVLVLPASVCASDTADMISRRVSGTVSFHNQNGCSQVPSDQQLTMDIMAGYAANPNVWGTLVVSLGCENCQMDLVVEAIRARTDKPVEQLIIQEAGGTLKAVEQGVRIARGMVERASREVRVPCDLSNIILGTECGGSDPTSGLAANPLVGMVSDWLVERGATSILSETPELIGAEHILARRAASEAVGQQIYDIIYRYEEAMARVGEKIREGNPSPGNKAGGITTLEEKSLGCTQKGGVGPVCDVLSYAQVHRTRGLSLVYGPGNDICACTALAAAGAQLILFTTGRGTPLGSPVPVLKVATNHALAQKKQGWIDFDAESVLEEPMTQVAQCLLRLTLETASGRETRSERKGYRDLAIFKDGVTL